MEECFRCGISGEERRLFDAIGSEGIVKLCEECLDSEGIPQIKKPTTSQLKHSEKLDRSPCFSPSAVRECNSSRKFSSNPYDVTLKDIVEKNYKNKVPKDRKPRPDLVENFHWVIMRARRAKHITASQLAKEIAEAEIAIKMAENGVLPEDDFRLIKKLESYLGIKLVKSGFKVETEEVVAPKRILNLEHSNLSNLTIADLKRMKEEKKDIVEEEEEIELEKPSFELPRESFGKSVKKDNFQLDKNRDLSEEEIEDLMFRR